MSTMKKKKHARYSPSKIPNLKKCLRFDYKQGDIDPETGLQEENAAAAEGTMLHDASNKKDFRGLTDEQRRAVESSLQYVDSVAAEMPGCLRLHETKVELEDLTYGEADVLLINVERTKGHVLDYKYGRLDTDYDDQLRTYAAAVLEMHEAMEEITTHVIAPRLGEAPTTRTYDRSLLAAVRAELTALYAEIENPFNPATPDTEVCGKCSRAEYCPQFNSALKPAVIGVQLAMPASWDPGNRSDPVDMARRHIFAGALATWIDAVKENNASYVAEGGEIPGFKLVQRSTGMKIDREATKTAVDMLRLAGFDDSLLWSALSLSLSEVAKLKKEVDGGDVAEYKEQMKAVLGDIIHEGSCRFLQKTKRIKDNELLAQLEM